MNTLENNKLEKLISMAMEEPAPSDVFRTNLRSRFTVSIYKEHSQNKSLWLSLRTAIVAILVLIIAATVLLNPKIVNAIRSIFYFIPGIGLTEPNPSNYTVISGEPTNLEGVSFQVTKGFSTNKGVTLLLEIKGLSAVMLYTPDESFRFPETTYKLRLDGENSLDLVEKSARWDGSSGYEIKLIFPPVSKKLSDATLWLSHTPFANPDLSPNNINMPIKFGLITDPNIGLPVIEIQTPIPTEATSISASQMSATETSSMEPPTEELSIGKQENYRIEVLHLIPDIDGTILLGRVYWTSSLPKPPRFSPLSIELRDKKGLGIPLTYYQVQDDIPLKTDTWLPWGLKTSQHLVNGNYKLSFTGLTVRKFTDFKIQVPTSIASDSSLLGAYVLPVKLDEIDMSLTNFSLSNTTMGTSLSFIVESKNQVESIWLTHEKLTNLDVSQVDTSRFIVNAGFSGDVDITNGSLVITSIDYHLTEPIIQDFQVP